MKKKNKFRVGQVDVQHCFWVGQVVAARISEGGWMAGEVGRIQLIEPSGTIELRGAKDVQHCFWPKELRCLSRKEI